VITTPGIAGENSALIQMTFTAGTPTLNTAPCPEGSGETDPNLSSPMELFGNISSSNLTIVDGGSTPAGNFNFTSSIITGTFSDALTVQGTGQITALESTANNALDLTLQQ
ncbi:MAG TPA: hypothetical protein VGL86_15955, partial [Polyangia bacterium]